MDKEVAVKFRKATAKLNLDKEMKMDLLAWYEDDHDDIKAIDQACFNLLVKQHCLARGFIVARKPDAEA